MNDSYFKSNKIITNLQSNYEDLANLLNDYADSLYELWLPESESLNKRGGFAAPWERMLLRK